MMDNLRAAANHVVLKIILGLIILSFLLTGVINYQFAGGDYAAKVNGEEISRAQLERAVATERNRQQQLLGDRFSELAGNEGFLQQMRQQALAQLVDETLIDQYADSLNLAISDQQVKQAIFEQPAFQTNGKFDNARYLSLIANIGMNADQYAQALRQDLKNQQLVRAIMGTDFMLPGETAALAALVSQERTVREAVINVAALAEKQSVSEDELNNAWQQNKNSYLAPEQFRVSYIMLDAASMQKPASEAEIQSWYDRHRQEYTQPQRNRYSVIQTKTEADANSILEALKNGGDFAELAKTRSVDPITAKKGGDMGWLEQETTPDELKNAGLTEKGQLSGALKSSVGYLVARLDDTQPERVKPLSEVHDAIAERVKVESAVDAYYKLQGKVSEAASNDNESLLGAEQAAGVKLVETPWFSRDSLPAELNFKPVQDAIFNGALLGQNGAPGPNSDIITVDGDRAFVLRISEHKPEAVRPLSEVRDRVITQLKMDKARQQARQEADKLLAELKAGKGDAVLSDAGLTLSAPKTFTRSGQDSLTQAVFELPKPTDKGPSWGTGEDGEGNLVLLALDSVRPGKLPAESQKAMAAGMAENNAQIVFAALMSNLRKDAKVKYGAAAQAQ
ncbi:peptidylprolyl isomerase [Pantoea sp. 1.19]|uniref:peptidylprolyl isomerase n=1 Tax=Pantoea sp. 1.19 TaxID=1925589 RepID=UPI000948E621|nr:peptidylprolyl isomerase [Pantoea sp. 1.19]